MKKRPNYDMEVSTSILEWLDYCRTNNPPLEHRVAIQDSHKAFTDDPNRATAAEVVTLVRLFMEKPVP